MTNNFHESNLEPNQTKNEFRIFVLVILFLIPYLSFAQPSELKFEHLTIDDGLAQNKINSICQDNKGFMWFGSNEGLNKYDGYEFTIFEKRIAEKGYLYDDYIKFVFEDSKFNLWIGTGNGGLYLYDYNNNNFIHFKQNAQKEYALESEIQTIIEDKQGNIWVARRQSIEIVEIENLKTTPIIQPQLNDKSNNSNINVIFFDSENKLWIGTNNSGLEIVDLKTKKSEYYRHLPDRKNCISDDNILSIYEDSHKNIWVGTFAGGLNYFDKKRNEFKRFIPDTHNRESLTVRAILENDTENLWLGTRNGLYLFNTKSTEFKHYAHNPHNPNSINQNNIQTIFKDTKGDFWFGTKDGINFLNSNNIPFVHIKADVLNNKYLNHKKVSAVLEDRYGDIWFGTVEGGLNQMNKKTGLFTYYTHKSDDPNSISSNNVNTITEDNNGDIWIGTFQGGLNHFIRKSKTFEYFKTDPDQPLLHQEGINYIVNSKNKIWVSSGILGLKIFDKKTHTFSQFYIDKAKNKIKSIWGLYIDKNNDFWCGGNESQIYKVNLETLESIEYNLPLKGNQTIINAIMEAPDGNLWIATRGSGLVKFDRENNEFQVFTKEDGIPNNDIRSMIVDNDGNLWLATLNGLCRFNIQTKKVKNFFKENGLPSNQFTLCSGYKTKSGKVFFGTINGAVAFYPNEIVKDNYKPPLVITDFTIFNKPVEIGGENPILNTAIINAKNVNLSYNHSVFTFTYAALNYFSSDLIKYAYKMEGFDKEWNYVGNRRFATYTNLNPGTYTFRVKAENSDGEWTDSGASVKILIAPPFWATWWFSFIMVAIFISIITFFVSYYIQKRNLQKANSLANLTQLKLLRNQMNPHFLLNAFNALRALVLFDKEHAWQMISEFSEYFRYVLIKYNKIQDTLSEEIDAAKNYINIQKLLNDNLEVSFQVNKAAQECVVPAFIFQPLIENAIKYGKKTSPGYMKIKVRLNYESNILSIDVANSGKIYYPETQDKKENKKEDKTSTSISNIKKRLEIMFGNNYSFELFEKRNYVHAKIIIHYTKKGLQESINYKANELVDQISL